MPEAKEADSRFTMSDLSGFKIVDGEESKSKALVAVDLHGTIADKTEEHSGEYDPAAYELQPGAVEALQELRDDGHEVAIWTCWATEEAREWLDEKGVPYDYVNEEAPDHGSPKIDAEIYIDDKSIRHEGDWNRTLAEAYATGKLDKGLCVIHNKGPFDPKPSENARKIVQSSDGKWYVVIPRFGRLGPFDTKEEAERHKDDKSKTAHEVACPECGGVGCGFCNDAGTIRTADDKVVYGPQTPKYTPKLWSEEEDGMKVWRWHIEYRNRIVAQSPRSYADKRLAEIELDRKLQELQGKKLRYVGKSRTGGQVWYRS